MKHHLTDRALDYLRSNPARFMMYKSLRAALRDTPQFRGDARGIIVCIVDNAWTWHAKRAAEMLLSGDVNLYTPKHDYHSDVQIIDGKKTREGGEYQLFLPEHQTIIVAPSRDVLPRSLTLAADIIVDVPPVSAQHIKAAREIARLEPISLELAEFIARQERDVIIGLTARQSLKGFDVASLGDKARTGDRNSVKLSDLPGYGPARPWVANLKADVDDWRAQRIPWTDVSKGILLCGPPGVGKTLFAQGLANELGFKLIATSVGEWQGARSGHLGTMLAAMSKSFADAAECDGAVLLIDELDSIGDRTKMRDGHAFYEGNVINRFLELVTQLFERPGVVLVGATNYPHLIDAAIQRSGRLEEHIYLELPDEQERAEILAYHLDKAVNVSGILPITNLLRLMTPADLEKLAREAKRHARHRKVDKVGIEDVKAVLPAKEPLPEQTILRVAIHEVGHALVALGSGLTDEVRIRVEKFTIKGATVQDGGRMHYQAKDMALPTERQLLSKIRVALAGMAAEEVVFQSRSIGSGGVIGSDLDQATRMAYRLVDSYGLGKSLRFGADLSWVDESYKPSPEVRSEADGLLAREYRAAKDFLSKDKEQLKRLAAELVVGGEIHIGR